MIDAFSATDQFDRVSAWTITKLQSTMLWHQIIVPLQEIEPIIIYYYRLIFG